MTLSARRADVEIHPFRTEDEPDVLELLRSSLGSGPIAGRPPEFFRWKHFSNPFGRSLILAAWRDGRIVGVRPFMMWRFRAGDRTLTAARAVDTATHPDYQGLGIFSRLTREALAELTGRIDVIFNTPNDRSGPGYLKMGWKAVGNLPVSIAVRRPIRFVRRLSSLGQAAEVSTVQPAIAAQTAATVLQDGRAVERLLEEAGASGSRWSTDRDARYLRWRYAEAPRFDYRAACERDGDRLRGVIFFRVRARGSLVESVIGDLLVRPGDASTARRLLRKAVKAASVDHVVCSWPRGSTRARASLETGFVRSPRGMRYVVNPLTFGLVPEADNMASWDLSLGDLEVF